MPTKSGNGKRELIDTGTDKRYVRRDEKGSSRNLTIRDDRWRKT